MASPPLSVALLTTGRQALIAHSIRSVIGQMLDHDELVVSVNSEDQEVIRNIRGIVESIGSENQIKIVTPPKTIPVYSHYRFAFENARHDHVIILHDDDIYNSTLLEETRHAFSDPGVAVVTGGLLKVELYGGKPSLSESAPFPCTETIDGRTWLYQQPGLYPRFCYSALSINRRMLSEDSLNPKSTAADCLLIAQLALAGKVYQTKSILATWSQLPFRTSRWSIIDPDLITPWIEFYDFYHKAGEKDLADHVMKIHRGYLKSFLLMLFTVGVINRDIGQIRGCLIKISEISPFISSLLKWTTFAWIYSTIAIPLGILRTYSRRRKLRELKSSKSTIDAPSLLKIDPIIWQEFIEDSSQLASD